MTAVTDSTAEVEQIGAQDGDDLDEEKACEALDAAHDRMYVAALRYARTFERSEIDPERINLDEVRTLGNASADLAIAVHSYDEAYERLEACGYFTGADVAAVVAEGQAQRDAAVASMGTDRPQ